METITLRKAKVTNAILARAVAQLQEMPALGGRSGSVGSDARAKGDAIRLAVLVALITGDSVEMTDAVLPLMTGKSNEYHLGWSRTRTFEKLLGRTFTVTMFVSVENETKMTITGKTATSKGHGRVFVTLN